MKTIKLKKPTLPEWATPEYDNGITSFDPSTLSLHLEPEQKASYLSGTAMRERLSNEGSANLATLEYLQKHTELLPEGWKGKYIYGWGTIVRDRHGGLSVPYLFEDGVQVRLVWYWLDGGFRVHLPALRFASQPSALPSSEKHSEPLDSDLLSISTLISEIEERLEGIKKLL